MEFSRPLGNKDPRILKLELDIDGRILCLWEELDKIDENDIVIDDKTREILGEYMRAAYGLGYTAALTEKNKDRGKMMRDHGYDIPATKPLPLDPEID